MANAWSNRDTNLPPRPQSTYDSYRPSSRHDLHMPFYDNSNPSTPPVPPPHSQQLDPFNPYPRTEDTQPYTDYSPYSNKDGSTPYLAPTLSQQSFQPLNPPQGYQDNYMKPNEYPTTEAGFNAPTPPPPKQRTLLSRLFDGDQRFAWFCWTISIIQIGIFIGELIKNAMVMGTPIEIHPTFNPLIGPSSYVFPLPTTLI
jgi:hypothetical protein